MEEPQEQYKEEHEEKQGGIKVSLFDYSVQNHFHTISSIYKLTKQSNLASQNDHEFSKLASSVTFLTEWKYFSYKPRVIKFDCETKSFNGKDCPQAIILPQFSSATVPKNEEVNHNAAPLDSSEDFVMNVGGSVWAMDWCPRDHEKIDCPVKLEFLAVAAHPPESYYHKLGSKLTGRGLVQIWCVLNPHGNKWEAQAPSKRHKQRVECKEGDDLNEFKRPRGRPRKKPVETAPKPKKPKGRPRKIPIIESTDNLDESLCVQPLVVQYPGEEISGLIAIEGGPMSTQEQGRKVNKGRKRKTTNKEVSLSIPVSETKPGRKRKTKVSEKENQRSVCEGEECPLLLTQGEERETNKTSITEDAARPYSFIQSMEDESSNKNRQTSKNSDKEMLVVDPVFDDASLDASSCLIPKDVALPRVVLCIAHNGKVAWDVKWRPYDKSDTICQHRMGFLAVLLGNGSLEVWDVPLPHAVKSIYSSSSCKDGDDPRFVKLEPVFRCSHLKIGGTQSIPMTVEWSTSCFQDYLLAGCHDGMVAVWKFSISDTSHDATPLLFFSADTNPIRSVSWAPMESDQEGASVIVTAGQFNLKFWDIRDPFRPLWDFQTSPRFISSLDWLPNPRCVIFSCDDGIIKLLSMVKAAYDSHLGGKPSAGPKQGLNTIDCSSSSIWSIHVAKSTGSVAYCCTDGTVKRFPLTRSIVERDPSKYQIPHFVCGSLREDESGITVFTPASNVPLNSKKPAKDASEKMKTIQAKMTQPNDDRRTKANNKVSDTENKVLSLCYGNDPCVESEGDETLASLIRKSRKKPTKNRKEKAAEDQQLICRDEEDESLSEKQSGKGGSQTNIETMPSKLVAMHRVRWNMNKGSERWLCSGGAAGILRCQEIILTDSEMRLPSRR